MPTLLKFTLSEDAAAAFYDALLCLNRFSDDVSFDATREKVILSAMNLTKTAHASITFATSRFFSRYAFEGSAQHRDRFYCVLYSKALLAVFRSRANNDPQRSGERESTIDRCDVAIEDGGQKSRFIAAMVSRTGITSTYQLPFEPNPPLHAKFDEASATNHWSISSRTLRKLLDHFGLGVEYLDVHSDGSLINFGCFPEKKGVPSEDALRKPLSTSIAVEPDEFASLSLAPQQHCVVSVRDVRAIVTHAASTVAGPNPFPPAGQSGLGGGFSAAAAAAAAAVAPALGGAPELEARYSAANRPMRITYFGDGIACRFLLMTLGESSSSGASAAAAAAGGAVSSSATAPGARQRTTRKGRAANGASAAGPALSAAAASASATPAPTTAAAAPPASMGPPPPPGTTTTRAGGRGGAGAGSSTTTTTADSTPQRPQHHHQRYPFGIVPAPQAARSVTGTFFGAGRSGSVGGGSEGGSGDGAGTASADAEPSASPLLELFVGQPDGNDFQWDPVRLDQDDEDEADNARLGWDTSDEPNRSAVNLSRIMSQNNEFSSRQPPPDSTSQASGLEPTQRLDEVRRFGLFANRSDY